MRLQSATADPSATSTSEPLSVSDALAGLVDKLAGWLDAIILALPNFVLAVLIVIVSAMIARLARRGVKKVLGRLGDHMESTKRVQSLLGTLAYVAVLSAGTFIALGVLSLDGVVTSLLAGAGILGLALGFAFQDIASNFIAGVLLAVRAPFQVGDLIKTNDYLGTVRQIDLRATHIETFQGQTVIIPNAAVYQNPLVNYTETASRRVDIACGVGYGDDLDTAERVAKAAVEDVARRDASQEVELFYTEFGDSSINFMLRFWIEGATQGQFLAAQSDAIKRIKAAFDQEGVTIPFPIRTLDFDPNGGLALREALPDGLRATSSNGDG
ncbi:MAG: mechanosensitive ion channel [Rhodothermaceae bacterium]|nr:mechanosensitive ion channel [Rhodothermaceae bacterium]